MKADQRAWVGPVELGQSDFSFPSLAIPLKNFGKTPALGVKNDVNGISLPKGRALALQDIQYQKQVEGPVQSVIYPGQQRDQVLDLEAPEDEVKAINAGDRILYLWGYATYEDVYGIKHDMHWCQFWHARLKRFDSCRIYNFVD
jgi:hypothetical protein